MSCNSLLSSTNADLARFYLLNEESGTTATDLSSVGDDGTYARDASLTTTTGPGGGYGLGQAFNGTSDQILSSATSLIDEDTTLVAWLNTADAGGGHIVSNHDASAGGLSLYMTSGGRLAGYIHSTAPSANSDVAVNDSSWHHCAVSYASSGRGLAYYVDGVAQGTATASGTWTTAKAYAVGGKEGSTAAVDAIAGSMAAAAVFSAVLSSTEVAQLAAGPEPIWLGTGTHHFNVARGTAYWNCPSTAWGLPTYLNAASTDNGALTAEVRIVRDRGKATEAVVATTTGFSGSVACAGSTDNLTLELRVSNDGGYDDSLGDDADGWVSVAWYGLEAKLVGQWNLDEQSGTVARNQVRTTLVSEDFSGALTSDPEGPLPPGAYSYKNSEAVGDTYSRIVNADGSMRITTSGGATGIVNFGIGYSGFFAGENAVLQITYKVVSITSGKDCRFRVYDGAAWNNVATAETGSEWVTATINLGATGVGLLAISATAFDANATIVVDVQSYTVYAENAGTYDRDASLTHETVSGLGSITDAQAFNGTSDEVVGSALGLPDADQTISAWVKTTTTDGGYIVSTRDGSAGGLSLYLTDTGTLRAYIGSTVASSSGLTAAKDGEWHHVALRYRQAAGTCDYFIDGLLDITTSLTGTWTSSVVTTIGNRTGGTVAATYFDGSLSTVNIHSRALTGPEIAQLYAQGPTALVDVGRVAHYKLEETAGDVCRNQIRTQLFSFSDFGDLGSTDAYGDIPSGWSRYTTSTEGDETGACDCDSANGIYTLEFSAGAGGSNDNLGIRSDVGIVIGRTYVVEIRARIRSVSAVAALRVNLGGSANFDFLDETDVGGGYVDLRAVITAAGASTHVFVYVATTGDVVADIASITITEENAGTPTADMSGLTAPGIVGRGIVLAGSNHIQAPYEAAFDAYPFSFGCAIQHDNTAAGRVPIAICNPAATDVYWRLQLNPSHEVLIVRRVSGGAEVVTATGVTLDTKPHTLLAVFPSATAAKLYVDGALVYNGTGLTSQAAAANSKAMMIGGYSVLAPAARWVGLVDEASFWERELSDDEAAEHHQFIAFPLAVRNSAEPLGLSASLKL